MSKHAAIIAALQEQEQEQEHELQILGKYGLNLNGRSSTAARKTILRWSNKQGGRDNTYQFGLVGTKYDSLSRDMFEREKTRFGINKTYFNFVTTD